MIKRWQLENLESAMKARRGVNLTGARQVGKSTLAGMLERNQCKRYTFDNKATRDAAAGDPLDFVRHANGETIIIDEVQKVPAILDAIKIVLDQDNARGQYLLTGSSNLHFAKSIRDSLAGRLGKIRLRSLALGEMTGGKPDFLKAAFERSFASSYEGLGKREVIHLAFKGGYPEPLEFTKAERRHWFKDYLDDLVNKDVREITEIRKISQMHIVAQWMLAYTAQFFAIDELAAKAELSKVTVENYIEALRALYLFDRVEAWGKSDYDFVGKRSKWIATDPALVANILGWDEEEVYFDEHRCGKLVETWVYQQLASISDMEDNCLIRHYRDNRKREIDFVVERDDGRLLGIEVKSGQVGGDDFRTLKWFAQNLGKNRFTGVVLYSGKETLRFGEGFYAVPLGALRG